MKYGTLLVIDDNPSILTALKICLGNTFERILTLSRPDTAPTLLQQEQVDLILLDMNFSLGVNSGQDGLLWLRTFRRLHAHIPVVLITAFADVQLAIKGLKSGAADFVTKPWDNDELIRTLKDAIDRSQEVETLESIETTHIHKVVDQCHGNISRAAEHHFPHIYNRYHTPRHRRYHLSLLASPAQPEEPCLLDARGYSQWRLLLPPIHQGITLWRTSLAASPQRHGERHRQTGGAA